MSTVGWVSLWQTGLKFLSTRREDWPVRLPGKIVEDKHQAANQKQSSTTPVCTTPIYKLGQFPVNRTEPKLVQCAQLIIKASSRALGHMSTKEQCTCKGDLDRRI